MVIETCQKPETKFGANRPQEQSEHSAEEPARHKRQEWHRPGSTQLAAGKSRVRAARGSPKHSCTCILRETSLTSIKRNMLGFQSKYPTGYWRYDDDSVSFRLKLYSMGATNCDLWHQCSSWPVTAHGTWVSLLPWFYHLNIGISSIKHQAYAGKLSVIRNKRFGVGGHLQRSALRVWS